jgi:hypothetical protein
VKGEASLFVAPASCRLSRGRLALAAAGGTPAGQPPGRRRYKNPVAAVEFLLQKVVG